MKKLLLTIGLLASVCYAGDIQEILGPFGCLDDTHAAVTLPNSTSQSLLNVDIQPQGKSVKKRKGYGTAFTLSNATSPTHGVFLFYDSNGSDVALSFNDRNMNVSVSGATPVVFFSTGPNGATYQCVDSLSFAYCANTSRTSIVKVNSSTYTLITTVNSTGTILAVTPERLVMAGFSDDPSRIDFSKPNDFATWTVGATNAIGLQITITSPGSKITHLAYAHGRIYWFKDSSFGYVIIGPTDANAVAGTGWQVVTLNNAIGTLYNTSIFRDDILYFQGNDGHFYSFDGTSLVKLSTNIQATIEQTQGRSSNSWSQTTQADWNSGTISPSNYLSTTRNIGSIVLTTQSAISPFIDSVSTDFAQGTPVSIDTTTIINSILLSLGNNFIAAQSTTTGSALGTCGTNPSRSAQAFYLNNGIVTSSITLNLSKVSGSPTTMGVSIWSNANNAPSPPILSTSTLNVSSISGATFVSVAIATVNLSGSSTSWIVLQPDFDCGTGNIGWTSNAATISSSTFHAINSGGSTITLTTPAVFKVGGRQYSGSGTFLSQLFDVGFSTNQWIWNWDNFLASGTIPIPTTLTWQTQTSSSPTGIFEALASVSTGSIPASTVQRYIRYKASLGTTELSTSPIVSRAIVNISSFIRPVGVFYSQVNNAPNISSWDSFNGNQNLNDGTISWFVRSATGSFTQLSSTPSVTSIPINSIPTISTGIYFQAIASFSVTSINQNPILNDFTFNWFEGAASDKTYAIYHDNSLWWSVASGTGASANNKILKYDLLNQGWVIYDIPMNGMYERSQSLYFGAVDAGKVYKFGDIDNDNGSAINAYWKSKDFFGTNPFLDKGYTRLSVFAGSVANSTMTVTYTVSGTSVTAYNLPLYNASRSFVNFNKNLPQRVGNTINLKFGNNAADQPFEVYGAQIDSTEKPWSVFP